MPAWDGKRSGDLAGFFGGGAARLQDTHPVLLSPPAELGSAERLAPMGGTHGRGQAPELPSPRGQDSGCGFPRRRACQLAGNRGERSGVTDLPHTRVERFR